MHVVAPDGTSNIELNGPGLGFTAIGYPTWSSDGRRLMFDANKQFARRVLLISGVDGSGLTQVLDGDQAGGFHIRSPDGTQVLYIKDDQIWLANVTVAAQCREASRCSGGSLVTGWPTNRLQRGS